MEPTCTADGYTLHTCSCGDSYLDDIVDALGHNYVESETETGTVFTCSRCGDSYAGHTHSYTETVTAPTCTEAGYTTYTCSCGDSYTGNTVAALGHNYVQSGDVYTCSRCGDSYSGHQHTYTETVTEPTCEQDGYTTYTCSCGYSYTDNVVPALGHDYVLAGQDGTMWAYACTRCGHSYTVVAPIVPEPPVEYSLRRSSVSVTTEHHEYVYASGTLLRETITITDAEGNTTTETLDFVYDLAGSPYALNYTNGAAATQTYYYITNIQGDVTHLVTADGEVVAEYGYDAWGKVTAATGSMAEVNPLRYRGYYADAESGFYYVSSRYCDPAACRFINADEAALIGANGDFVSLNLFAYCGNNPASRADTGGYFWHIIVGAVVGVATQYVADVVTNLASGKSFTESLKPTSSIADYASAAISGAVAATGIGLAGSVAVNAALGGGTYLANCALSGEEANTTDFMLSVIGGGISGLAGGKGANGAKLRGIYKYSKNVLKTTSSAKRVIQYTMKMANCYKSAVKSMAQTMFAGGISNLLTHGRKWLTDSAV